MGERARLHTPNRRAGPNVGRECPGSDELRAAFRIEVKRKQRRSDGTVSLDGQRFEIPSRYRRLDEIHLRYARWDFSRIDLINARSGQILCPVRPLDKAANADALRRRVAPNTATAGSSAMPAAGIALLMKQMIADYAATGIPPAYLPTADKDDPVRTKNFSLCMASNGTRSPRRCRPRLCMYWTVPGYADLRIDGYSPNSCGPSKEIESCPRRMASTSRSV